MAEPKKSSNAQYIVAIVVMMFIAVIGIVVILIARPGEDNAVIIAALFGFLSPTTLALLAYMKSDDTHKMVNSRLDQMMDDSNAIARAVGVTEGRLQGKRESDERTDALREVKG